MILWLLEKVASRSPRNLKLEWIVFEGVLQTFSFNLSFTGQLLCAQGCKDTTENTGKVPFSWSFHSSGR